jgi:hypothetical protein
MRYLLVSALLIMRLGSGAGWNNVSGQNPQTATVASPGLTLMTTAFEDGAIIPARYTRAVENPVSPKLEWTNVPRNTVSFTLILHDPDMAASGLVEDTLHWIAFNIPGTAVGLPEAMPPTAKLPDGTIQGKGSHGDVGFRGPGAAAPGPFHHYTFELFALDTKLDLGPEASRADVLKAMNGHILGKAVLVGRFHR